MAEYNFVVLWSEDPGTRYPIETDALPLTPETRSMLNTWAARYHDHLNWDDPGHTPDWDPQDLRDFEDEGVRIWLRLRAELAPEFEVGYRGVSQDKTAWDPRELQG